MNDEDHQRNAHFIALAIQATLSFENILNDHLFIAAIKYLSVYSHLPIHYIIRLADGYRSRVCHVVDGLITACLSSRMIAPALQASRDLRRYLKSARVKFVFTESMKKRRVTIIPGRKGRGVRRLIRKYLSIRQIIATVVPLADEQFIDVIECLMIRLG